MYNPIQCIGFRKTYQLDSDLSLHWITISSIWTTRPKVLFMQNVNLSNNAEYQLTPTENKTYMLLTIIFK